MAAKGKATSQTIYEEIKNDIIQRKYPANYPLGEESLAESYHVSRTPVREALKRLENDGLIISYPFRGCYVREIGPNDIVEIYTIRQALEEICCRQAAKIISHDAVLMLEEKMKQAWEELEKGNFAEASRLSSAMHQVIIRASCNMRIGTILDQLQAQCQYLDNIASELSGRMEKSLHEHDAIIAALKSGDGDRAAGLLREHIASTEQDMLTAMSNENISQHLGNI